MRVHINTKDEKFVLDHVTAIMRYPTYIYFKAKKDSTLKPLHEKWRKNGIPHALIIDIYVELLSQ